jgi:hypothetical protein
MSTPSTRRPAVRQSETMFVYHPQMDRRTVYLNWGRKS